MEHAEDLIIIIIITKSGRYVTFSAKEETEFPTAEDRAIDARI
jgi:hypothetical protein